MAVIKQLMRHINQLNRRTPLSKVFFAIQQRVEALKTFFAAFGSVLFNAEKLLGYGYDDTFVFSLQCFTSVYGSEYLINSIWMHRVVPSF